MSHELPSDAPQGASKRSLIPKAKYYPLAFKCFDVEQKVMLSPDEVMAKGVFVTSTGHFVSADGKPKPYQRLCYTGLKDSAGIHLFEGDVCKVVVAIDMGLGFPAHLEKWAVMRWVKGGFTFIMPDVAGQHGAFEVTESYYQGNEWANPELLDNLLPNE